MYSGEFLEENGVVESNRRWDKGPIGTLDEFDYTRKEI